MAWQANAIDLTPASWAEGPDAIAGLADLLRERSWTALTGAGASTDSGIPDYRGPTSVRATPMQFAEFVRSRSAQQRYWARSYLGWARMGHAEPNQGHRALVDLESAGLMGIVTQNVDGLHTRAGSRTVVNLHGEIAWVVCLDGDAVVQEWRHFVLADCSACGGRLKPDVVFFGESVPKDRVQFAYDLVDAGDVLVVLGSSLTVMSGLRFVRHLAKLGREVVIVNRGVTRGDPLATVKIDGGCAETLVPLLAALRT
jgi:NAD-dependent SIR2 family protein deacetylase